MKNFHAFYILLVIYTFFSYYCVSAAEGPKQIIRYPNAEPRPKIILTGGNNDNGK